MKKKLLLIFSLAFNIGFIVAWGYHFYARSIPQPRQPRHPQSRFLRLKNTDIEASREETNRLRKQLFGELAKSELDTLQINATEIALTESQVNMEKLILQHLKKTRQEMSDAEAEEFFFHLAQRIKQKPTPREQNK